MDRCKQCDQTHHTTGIEQELCQEYQKRIETHCWCSGAAVHDADLVAAEFVKNCLVVVPLGYYEGERRDVLHRLIERHGYARRMEEVVVPGED